MTQAMRLRSWSTARQRVSADVRLAEFRENSKCKKPNLRVLGKTNQIHCALLLSTVLYCPGSFLKSVYCAKARSSNLACSGTPNHDDSYDHLLLVRSFCVTILKTQEICRQEKHRMHAVASSLLCS